MSSGPDKMMNLTTTSVTRRLIPALKAACDQLSLKLDYVATENELQVLRQVAESKGPNDIREIIKDLYAEADIEKDIHGTMDYIRTVLNTMKVQSCRLYLLIFLLKHRVGSDCRGPNGSYRSIAKTGV